MTISRNLGPRRAARLQQRRLALLALAALALPLTRPARPAPPARLSHCPSKIPARSWADSPRSPGIAVAVLPPCCRLALEVHVVNGDVEPWPLAQLHDSATVECRNNYSNNNHGEGRKKNK